MNRVALVGCSASKLPVRAPARELYTGDLFRRALRFTAAAGFDSTFVLSALHGAVPLDRELDPYDFSLQRMEGFELALWGHTTLVQLATLGVHLGRGTQLHVFAGQDYAAPLEWQLPEWPGLELVRPLRGLGIGKQKAFLAEVRP